MAERAGVIEAGRKGSWTEQAISRLNPKQGVNLIISGPVTSDLNEGGTSTVDFTEPQDTNLYLVGMGFRKDTGYKDTLLNCSEIWIPFEDEVGQRHVVRFKIDSLTSFTDWIYVWTNKKTDDNKLERTWVPTPFVGEDVYEQYEDGREELDYEIAAFGPGNIIFVPYIHPNYLTTDDYNGILGNVMKTAESVGLYSVLRNDADPWLQYRVSPNLRYKHYLQDNHNPNAIGGLHAGELMIPGGYLSRVVEESEYFKSFRNRSEELDNPSAGHLLQTLDLPYMSYRAISGSVYVDQYTDQHTESGSAIPTPLKKVWEDMQGGNTDDPETVYFVNKASITQSNDARMSEYIKLETRTSIPVTGSILFRMDGHLAVRFTKATIYAPFLNTVYRTGEYGEILDSFTSQSVDGD